MRESLKLKNNTIGKRVIVTVLCLVVALVSVMCYREQAFGKNELIDEFDMTSSSKCQDQVTELIEAIITGDNAELDKFQHVIPSTILKEMKGYASNNNIDSTVFSDKSVEFINADNSSTEDTVIMANVKLYYKDYNKLYLFEFHMNEGGSIYGYNIWQW